jgi:hypothetical protein
VCVRVRLLSECGCVCACVGGINWDSKKAVVLTSGWRRLRQKRVQVKAQDSSGFWYIATNVSPLLMCTNGSAWIASDRLTGKHATSTRATLTCAPVGWYCHGMRRPPAGYTSSPAVPSHLHAAPGQSSSAPMQLLAPEDDHSSCVPKFCLENSRIKCCCDQVFPQLQR